jgi:hypothetical protein
MTSLSDHLVFKAHAKMRSRFYIDEQNYNHKIVFLVDRNAGSCSITNDAENVLDYFKLLYGVDWRVVYKDTDDTWWEIAGNYWGDEDKALEFKPWNGLAWDILSR